MAKYRRSRKCLIGIHDNTAPNKQVILLAILSIIFFMITLCSVFEGSKIIALILIILTLLGGIVCFPTLRERINLPIIMLLLFVLMNGISTTYALSGKFALREFLRIVIALCAGLLLMMLTPGEGVKPGRRIAVVLESCSALSALFSVDLISTRLLSTPLLSLLARISPVYENLAGVEPGVRMLSIFRNPNIFAGCVGIGVLLSLSLALSAEGKKERRFHLCCLYVSATAFVLAFSMGATFSIAIAFLVYLLLELRVRRVALLLLMCKTLILVAVSVALCAMTALDTWDGFQPIPLLCLIIGSVLLCLADEYIGRKLPEKLGQRSHLVLIAVLIIIVLLVGFVLVAYNLTGSISLAQNESLRRGIYPAPGQYTVSAESSGDIQVTIESQNRQDTMMHTSSVIYSGPLSGAEFTVPEDSMVVYFNFKASQPVQLHSVTYSGGSESGSVPLGYKLLPSFIANRLQGLFANQNAIQRLVFFEDGIKLFRRSPIIGLGLGAFENAIYNVQSFYYETKYVHNHYIQSLLETGVIGLIFFVGLLGVSAASVLFSRKKEGAHTLTPALGAALVFMAIHSATEVVFSTYFYLPLAFGVFILINLCCGDALSFSWLNRTVKSWTVAVAAVLIIVFGVLLSGNMMASSTVERKATFSTIENAISLDKYEWADYALSYVLSSVSNDVSEEIALRADQYAVELAKLDSNTIPFRLTKYYLQKDQVEQAMEMAAKYASYCSANSATWNNLFHLLSGFYLPTAEYHAGVEQLAAMMEEWDAENIGTIQLDEKAQNFLDFVLAQ